MTLLVMMVVSNSWVRAATSYRLGVRWGRGGRRGGLAPKVHHLLATLITLIFKCFYLVVIVLVVGERLTKEMEAETLPWL